MVRREWKLVRANKTNNKSLKNCLNQANILQNDIAALEHSERHYFSIFNFVFSTKNVTIQRIHLFFVSISNCRSFHWMTFSKHFLMKQMSKRATLKNLIRIESIKKKNTQLQNLIFGQHIFPTNFLPEWWMNMRIFF